MAGAKKEDRRRLPIGASGRREGGWNLRVVPRRTVREEGFIPKNTDD
jgi:hypothetical protein